MKTFDEMHAKCNRDGWPCSYWGERGDWLVVVGQHRDSDALGRSNFASALRLLGGEDENVAVERSNHWAVGWVEHILVRPGTEQAKMAEEILTGLEDYPIVDEEDFSRKEHEECAEAWERCFSVQERIKYLRNHSYSADSLGQLLRAVRGDWYEASGVLH